MRSSRHDDGALIAGLGFGGMEALIFALILTWTVVSVTFAPDSLRAQGIDATQTVNGVVGSGALYGVSRLSAIVSHLGFSTLCWPTGARSRSCRSRWLRTSRSTPAPRNCRRWGPSGGCWQ